MHKAKRSENLICAIDYADMFQAGTLMASVKDSVGAVKLGLEFFTANGIKGVREIAKYNVPIFLDLKFHDIPNTVAKAVSAAVKLGIFMLTIHTSGSIEMMRAAVKAAKETAEETGREKPFIIGVTVLTSMNEDDISDIGIESTVKQQVLRLASLAKKSGLDGVVCSSHEIAALRKACGPDFKLIVPGIRPKNSAQDDQKRIMTPEQALALGADYIVIGRPISQAKEPYKAVQQIIEEIEAAAKKRA